MTRAYSLIAITLVTLAALPAPGAAQGSSCVVTAPATSCSADFTLTLSTVRVMILELSTTQFPFPPVATGDLSAGYVASAGPGALIKSNAPWNLMISAGSQTAWQPVSGQASQTKPPSDLQWSTNESGPYLDLSGTSALAASGGAGGDFWTPFYFRTKVGWQNDTPGEYALDIAFVIIAP